METPITNEMKRLMSLFDEWGLSQYIPHHTESAMLASYLLSSGVIVPPCKVGDTVYLIYRGEVTQGTVRLIRPFVSGQETIFKGNIICEVDNLFIDDGTKEEHELYVVFEKPYGIERVAYLTHEEAEKALAERSNDGKS